MYVFCHEQETDMFDVPEIILKTVDISEYYEIYTENGIFKPENEYIYIIIKRWLNQLNFYYFTYLYKNMDII